MQITFRVVYVGIAIIKPKIPNSNPENIITINTSSGWDLIDEENIYGWSIKLSSIWIAVNPESNHSELVKKSLKIKVSMLLVADNIIIKKILINGPK